MKFDQFNRNTFSLRSDMYIFIDSINSNKMENEAIHLEEREDLNSDFQTCLFYFETYQCTKTQIGRISILLKEL